jgi:hypothetical protein
MNDGRKMTKRIPLTDITQADMRDFAQGLGVTYDEAIQFLLSRIVDRRSEDLMIMGRLLREDFELWQRQTGYEPG